SNPDLQRLTGEILSTIASTPSSPRFILNPSPYQSNLDLPPTYFEKSCKIVVDLTAEKVKKALKTGDFDLAVTILRGLAQERQVIATEQGSIDAKYFGAKRSDMNDLVTPLLPNTAYEEYERKFLNDLSQLCGAHKAALLDKEGLKISSKKMQGISSSFLCKATSLKEILSHLTDNKYENIQDWKLELDHLVFVATHFFKKSMKILKDFETFLDQPHIALMHTTTHLNMNEEKVPLSQFFFFFHQSELDKKLPEFAKTELDWNLPSNKPQVFLKTPSLLTLIHSDPSSVDQIMSYIDTKQLPLCFNSKTESELKEHVGLFLYLFAQATPYERGSAAIGEMMAKSICEAMGYKMEYGEALSFETESPLPDLDALTSITLDDYMQDFLSKCELEPLLPPL
ncbi:MAG: hypothetical protein V4489_06545, partial [Chlamydiota bacterium]